MQFFIMFSSLCNSEFGKTNIMIDHEQHEHVRYEQNHHTRSIRSINDFDIAYMCVPTIDSQTFFLYFSHQKCPNSE